MSGTFAWQTYEGVTLDDGSIEVLVMTNDDNDDGYPDGTTAEWTMTFKNRAAFDRSCGRCRIGISGIRVWVRLDGQEIR